MPKNQTSFTEGNKVAEKWKFIRSARKIIAFRNFVMVNEFKSVQSACFAFGLMPSLFDYLINKFAVFERIKKDIYSRILSDINDNALTGNYNPTASIWRMKQLGETDMIKTDHTTNGKDLNQIPINVVDNETAQMLNDILNGKNGHNKGI